MRRFGCNSFHSREHNSDGRTLKIWFRSSSHQAAGRAKKSNEKMFLKFINWFSWILFRIEYIIISYLWIKRKSSSGWLINWYVWVQHSYLHTSDSKVPPLNAGHFNYSKYDFRIIRVIYIFYISSASLVLNPF